MFNSLKKIWLDTTTIDNRYVAKDVKGIIAFVVGLLLLIASALSGWFSRNISIEPGSILLAYSLGNQAFKSYYQYKNNSVEGNCESESEKPTEND